MPADGFPFPVRVGGQIDHTALFGLGFQFLDGSGLAADIDILRGKVIFNVHPQLAFGQVPDVAHGSHHFVSPTQIFLNGFALGRAFHDDQFFAGALFGCRFFRGFALGLCRRFLHRASLSGIVFRLQMLQSICHSSFLL